MISRVRIFQLIGIACICAFLASVVVSAKNNENYLPYLSGLLDQTLMLAPSKVPNPKAKTYILPATPNTAQFGFFDTSQPPVLKINSGDTVVLETMAASDNQVVPGATIEQIIKVQTAVPGRGPHTVTGPIYVEGAEPGDTLKVHFNRIVPRPYASNNTGPNKGLFPKEFPTLKVRYFYLDLKKKEMQFMPGIVVPLAPFPGVVAVAPEQPGKYSSGPPGPFGGNLDLREMTEGSTLYLPVFRKGAFLWSGDSHGGQGNGEINLTAIETAFEELNMTIEVIKNKKLNWPRVETQTDWIAVGYDKDLNKAFDILQEETVKLIMEKRNVSAEEAKKIMFDTWNCPVAEVVNGVQGLYCMLPKQVHAPKFFLPKEDDAKLFVTHGKSQDLEQAMKIASMDMINKVAKEKKMDREDVYALASLTMDCRIAPYSSGEKEINCSMAKNLWK